MLIFSAFFLLSVVAMFAFNLVLQHSYAQKAIEEKLQLVQNQCSILGNQILVNQFIIDTFQSNLNVEIDQLANVWEGRILVIDSSYKIVKDTYTIDQNNYMIYDEVVRIMRGEKDKSIRYVDDYAEIIVPITNTDKVTNGVMIAMVSMKDIEDTKAYIERQAYVLVILFAVIALAVAFVLGNVSVKDINKLNTEIRSLNQGHLESLQLKSHFNELTKLTD